MPIPEKIVEAPAGPNTASSPWVGSTGIPANPNAPVGGGGPGFFESGIAGLSGNDSSIIPHPDSPVGSEHRLRQADIDSLDQAGVALDTNVIRTETKVERNAPPVTVVGTTTNKLRSNTLEEVIVTVTVVADGVFAGNDDGACLDAKATNEEVGFCEIEFNPPPTVKDGKTVIDPKATVTKIIGKMTFKPTVTLQIQYGKNIKATDPSAYGRGTTGDDVKNKDTTIGFHEACHLDDSRAYYKDTKNLPALFNGKVGDTVTAFQAKQQAWAGAFTNYFTTDGILSRASTDNPTRKPGDKTLKTLDEYIAENQGYKH